MFELDAGPFAVRVIDEPEKEPLTRAYAARTGIGETGFYWPRIGVVCVGPDGRESSRLLRTDGGPARPGAHMAVAVVDVLFVAIGHYVIALRLPDLRVRRVVMVDGLMCVGVAHSPLRGCLVAHGIERGVRLDLTGAVEWRVRADGSVNPSMRVAGDVIEITDTCRPTRWFDLATGLTLPND